MSYRSPIEVIYEDVQTKFEDNVFKAIQNVQINVDRDELIKALAYDRDQYRKGYADGIRRNETLQLVYDIIDEMFGAPCKYLYRGKDCGDRLIESGWCDKTCSEDLCTAGCWEKLFELLQEEGRR